MSSLDSLQLNVISQNILLDYTRTNKGLILSQSERIGSLAATMGNFSGELNVVGIQEAHKDQTQHNGEILAERLGLDPGFWFNHNQKQRSDSSKGRSGEYIGLFGKNVELADFVELGDNRRGVITVIADVAFMTVHLRCGSRARHDRAEQAEAVVSTLEPFEDAVVFGDFNEPPVPYYAKARDVLRKNNFESAFALSGQRHPVTAPISPYRRIISSGKGWQRPIVERGWSIDDILVRGNRISVLSAGVLERVVIRNDDIDPRPSEGSDHEGVWARLAINH